jgi:gamma-glutamylcyclotransferase (GGCT)/AIG2-like uncharacterized protein YtfP
MSETRLYFAYGRNMHPAIMAERCPGAEFVGPAVLPDYRLLINRRGVSTVVPDNGHEVHGVMWRLTDACEASLDVYEGIAADHYRKGEVRPVLAGVPSGPALVYLATDVEPDLPKEGYLEDLEDAAHHHEFPEAYRLFLSGLRGR